MAADGQKLIGVIGFYKDPPSIIKAMEKVRDANYRSFDAFTPYAVHGLEQAQGLKRSPIPYVTFGMGLTGFICAFALQYWTSAVDWPLIVGGKPFNSWPAFVPVMFELTVLFAGISTVVAMILFNHLPNTRQKIADPSLTRDRFAIMVDDPSNLKKKATGFKEFKASEVEGFLKNTGAYEVRKVYAEGWL